MTTLHLRNSVSRSPVRLGFLLIPLLLACFALLPTVQAVVPAPDGAYPGFNTAEGGPTALGQAVPGVWNTAIGQFALNLDVSGGTGNTAVGLNALRANTLGDFNSALGVNALRFNVIGSNNTGLGYQALFHNTGAMNTAVGVNALANNTAGFNNTAVGQGALGHNTTAANNVATGFQALGSNTTGGTIVVADELGPNTAIGTQALLSNITGSNNNAVGYLALLSNDGVPPQGSFNNAHGDFALSSNTTGRQNNAFGDSALAANVTGNFNTAIGDQAGVSITTNWNIDIGKDVFGDPADGSFVTRIGISADANTLKQRKCFIGGIENATVTGSAVFINTTTGQLGLMSSSARFKTEIKPMDKASEGILALKPVTFRYKQEIDPARSPQFGLLAEEVAKINPDLVTHDAKGELYTVRYEAVNAMLLNEFLKEHRKVEGLQASFTQQQKDFQATAAQQQKEIQALTASLKEQASQIQKVSDQLELSKSAPRTVLNNQ